MSSLLTYASLMSMRDKFREYNDFNKYDTPSLKFFKIFFYFQNGDSDSMVGQLSESGGLLAPTWLVDGIGDNTYYQHTSAWSYLKMNYEDERAKNLEQFINLLSNISSESPWYFTELSGLDAAIERKTVMDKDFKIEEARPKISIKCLPDAMDDRIGTLLDLYRSIVWSWSNKREVLPSNLRKFDMGIFIFEQPTKLVHYKDSKLTLNDDSDNTSFKYYELHNCEIDYGSAKGNLGTINNAEGVAPEYTIDIHFDDCYETRYNEMNAKWIGDMIAWDFGQLGEHKNITPSSTNVDQSDDETQLKSKTSESPQVIRVLDGYEGGKAHEPKGFLSSAVDQMVGTGINIVKGAVNKVLLGNLYTFSLTKMANQAKSLASGDVWSTVRNVKEYVDDAKQRKGNNLKVNLFGRVEQKKVTPRIKKLGNLATSNTIANNI